ncbi:hypothetical protein [Phaffia rhodozyma]|uniref:Uncharacterized protein n=1 Tax=Phaffia rhodozyma TaxID=264483 RepID=A0A0F7SN28_PHARH|nr:hypothetical protein [Phaffia rhodozyma]
MELPPRDSSKTSTRLTGHAILSKGITSATISSKAKINPRRSLSITVPGPSQHRVREVPLTNATYSRSRISIDELPKSSRRASIVSLKPLSKSTATVREPESRRDIEKLKAITWSALSQTLPTLSFSSLSSASSPPSTQLDSDAVELYLFLSTLQLRLAAHDISTSVQGLTHQTEEELAKLETTIGINIQDEQVENRRVLWEALTKRNFAHRFIPLLHELSFLNASADAFLDASPREPEDDGNIDERGSLARSEDLQNSFKRIQTNFEGLTSLPGLTEPNPQVLQNLLELYILSITDRIERLKSSDRETRRKRQERRQIVWEKSLEISQMTLK